MARPRKCRRVSADPRADYFKPRGVPMRELREIRLHVEGLEALRLADLEGLTHEQAAVRMNISRHTFGRVLAQARQTVARALSGGMALRIGGGHYEMDATRELPRARQERRMSIVAISSEGPSVSDRVDPRFGRAAGFVVVDTETGETRYLDNGASQARAQGAGIQAAETVASAGASVVLTGFVGPKAFQALRAAGIKVGQNLDNMSVAKALERYAAGLVAMADQPNR